MQEIGLQPGHVHAGRTLGLAGLAGQAEVQRLEDAVFRLPLRGQPPVEQRAQQVRPAPGGVLLLLGGHERGAHRPHQFLAADPGPVAKLHRAGETAVALVRIDHREFLRPVTLAETEVVGHGRGVHHLPRIHDARRVERRLQPPKRLVDARPEDLLVEVTAREPVAVLPAHGAPEVEHQVADLPGQGVHLPDLGGVFQVDQRPDVEAPGAGVRVEAALGVPPGQDFLEPADELRQPGWLDRGVLDEGDGLFVSRKAQEERKRRLPHRPDVLLLRGIEDSQVGTPLIAEPALEVGQLRGHFGAAPARELDQDECPRFALDEVEAPRILERLAGEVQNHPVHEFHRGGVEIERHHPRLEGREHAVEMQHREPDRGRKLVQLHPGLDYRPERSLGPDDQVRQVHPARIEQHVQVVAGDPARDAREPFPDLIRVLVPNRQQFAKQRGERPVAPRPAPHVLPAQP